MAFSQTTIQEARATRDGADTVVSWTSSSADGTVFQVYVDGDLAWHGTERRAVLVLTGQHRFDVGTVAAGEGSTSFASTLPAMDQPKRRVNLTWEGGSYLATNLPMAGFHVYASSAPGGSIDYSTIIGTVPVSVQGVDQGGFGEGGFGEGGFGSGNAYYTWTSDPLCPGVWQFGVKAFDEAGNESTTVTSSKTLTGPPGPPARNAAGKRMTYDTFHIATGHAYATLHWLAPASCS